MTTFPPSPFPWKGVTCVQPLARLPNIDSLPPCPTGISFGQGGPTEAQS